MAETLAAVAGIDLGEYNCGFFDTATEVGGGRS